MKLSESMMQDTLYLNGENFSSRNLGEEDKLTVEYDIQEVEGYHRT